MAPDHPRRAPDGIEPADTDVVGDSGKIAELRRALDATRQRCARLETLLDVTAPGRWELDIPTGVIELHDGWGAMLGYRPGELPCITREQWRALVHPDDLASGEAARDAHFAGLTPLFEAVFRMRHRDGGWVWIQCRASIHERDADGQPLGIAGANVDVTALRQAELDAQRAQRWLQAVVDAPEDVAIITTDAHGTITMYNPGAERLLGYAPEEVIGRQKPVIFHEPGELAARIARAREHFGRDVDGFEALTFDVHGRSSTNEWTFVCKDGSHKRVRLSISPIEDARGQRMGLAGIAVDLTPILIAQEQARIAAEKFTGAFEAAALGMALVSLEGRWMDANDAVCNMLGYRREELMQLDFQSVTHPDDLTSDLALLHQLLAGEISSYQLDKRYISRDGALVWGRLSVSLVRTPDGTPMHFVSQIQDVTLEKTSLLRLHESEERTRVTLDAVVDLVLALDGHGRVQYANAVAQRMLGDGTATALAGRDLREVLQLVTEYAPRSPLQLAPLLDPDDGAVDLGHDLLMPHAGGLLPVELTRAWLHDDEGRINGSVWVIRDVTQQRLKQREALRLAEIDPLTELANRRGFTVQLDAALRQLRDRGQPSSLVYLDLDGFKGINDRHGHPAGDLMLESVARVLKASVRDLDVVARMGGDEFAAILLGCSLQRAHRIALELSQNIRRLTVAWEGAVLTIGASIGVTPLLAEMTEDSALAAVDVLCYRAKARGHNSVQVAGESPGESAGT